ncbi:hypothetical protein [Nostoc sp.]
MQLNQSRVTPSFDTQIPKYLATAESLKASIEQDSNFVVDTNPKLEKTLELVNELIKTLES